MGILNLFKKKNNGGNGANLTNRINPTLQPFVFKSNHHQRYEDGKPVMGLQNCLRTVRVEKNENGCSGYQLTPGVGYIVKVFNGDLGKPNMADKPMKVVSADNEKIELRGYVVKAMTPFGWMDHDLSDYGFTVHYKNNTIEKCVLHMIDRNTNIEYLK